MANFASRSGAWYYEDSLIYIISILSPTKLCTLAAPSSSMYFPGTYRKQACGSGLIRTVLISVAKSKTKCSKYTIKINFGKNSSENVIFPKCSVTNFLIMRRIHVLTFLQFQLVKKLRYANIKDDFIIFNKLWHSEPDPDPKLLWIWIRTYIMNTDRQLWLEVP